MKSISSFNALFRFYRLRAAIPTLSEFGKALASEGFIFDDSIFSRWQKGNIIPTNRNLLVSILKIFINRGSITSLGEANTLLESAGQGYVTNLEVKRLFPTSQNTSKKSK